MGRALNGGSTGATADATPMWTEAVEVGVWGRMASAGLAAGGIDITGADGLGGVEGLQPAGESRGDAGVEATRVSGGGAGAGSRSPEREMTPDDSSEILIAARMSGQNAGTPSDNHFTALCFDPGSATSFPGKSATEA